MVRSWAYILMFAATLAGVVALVWPSPEVQTIEEIAMPARSAPPRAEAPAKPAKQAAKTPPAAKRDPAPAPAPAAVVKKMPAPNTTTRRQVAQPERQLARPDNGMQPSPFSQLGQRDAPNPRPTPPSAVNAPPRPAMPFKPGTVPGQAPRDPSAR